MNIQFTKMHGLGNDFMVVNSINQPITFTTEQIKKLSNRHTGVGFDQCLIVEPSKIPDIDFFYRIYNADGSEVGQCGNGARCLARFVHYHGLSHKKKLKIATHTTQMTLEMNDDDTVTVDMGPPKLTQSQEPKTLTIDQHPYEFYTIDVGNPHAVILSENIETAPVQTVGQQLSIHSLFPNQCNINFMHIINPREIELRVYERGVGETQACGSGAVAAMAIGALHHGLSNDVTIHLIGGSLSVRWPHLDGSVFLTGTANFVYEGEIFDTTMND